jgi:hypothetical protein
MATYSKIPQDVKAIGAIASGHYAVFCGLMKAGEVFVKLQKDEDKGKSVPLVGYVTIKGKKIYYCRYGLVDDPSIYKGASKGSMGTKK